MSPISRNPAPILRLLPRRQIRTNSNAPKLAKPTKFTPPSHPARRPRDPVNYPGPPRTEDPGKHYPHTMPPPSTWSHWFLNNRQLHFYLSLSVLAALAGAVTVSNFLRTSPYAKEIAWDWGQPVGSGRRFVQAWKKSVEAESVRVKELRSRAVEDVEKRGEFRKAHGLEEEGMLGGWEVKKGLEDGRARGDVLTQMAREETKGMGQSGAWVEEELRKLDEEVEGGVAKVQGAYEEEVKGKGKEKKSSWRWW